MKALLAEINTLRASLAAELAGIDADDASAAGAAPPPSQDQAMASFAAFRCMVSAQLGGPIPEDEVRQTFAQTQSGGVGDQKTPDFVYTAILEGEDRWTAPKRPILAIVPVPRTSDLPMGSDPAARKAADDLHTKMQEGEIATLQSQQPAATIVRIPHGHHYIFLSNPEEVVRAIAAFGDSLP
jgi:pimeloyl-ACP methyl ester carboxylesterase